MGVTQMDLMCLEFVNSEWYISHKSYNDPLKNVEWLNEFAVKWNIKIKVPPTKMELKRIIDMRTCFRTILLKEIEAENITDTDLELINGYLSDVKFHRKIRKENDQYRVYQLPEKEDWSWFIAEIAASLSQLVSSGDIKMLKVCQNPECKWFFIDESKSRSRKWCDDSCANVMKVRRFRQKQKGNKE